MAIFFNKKNLNESVRELLNTIEARSGKINEQIANLKEEEAVLVTQISELMSDLVTYELDDDAPAQMETNKKLSRLREKLTVAKEKIAAYQAATTTDIDILVKRELPKITELAKTQRSERFKEIAAMRTQKANIEQEIKNLQQQIENVDGRIRLIDGKPEARELLPLLKYIESRPVSRGSEESYLSCYINDSPVEILAQYIEKPEVHSRRVVGHTVEREPLPVIEQPQKVYMPNPSYGNTVSFD